MVSVFNACLPYLTVLHVLVSTNPLSVAAAQPAITSPIQESV